MVSLQLAGDALVVDLHFQLLVETVLQFGVDPAYVGGVVGNLIGTPAGLLSAQLMSWVAGD